MCSNNPGSMIPYGLKVPSLSPYMPLGTALTQLPLDFHRAHLYDYNARLQYGLRGHPTALGLSPYAHAMDTLGHPYVFKQDLRARYIHEEPKPSHSYIGLIAMAILSHKDKKLVLSDIYQWILDNYAYFRTRGPGWRNSIRHNLSLNDCFIKSGRSANGKGHYWAIHPANLEDFQKGDFRRRRAQRRVRKHMGLSVPEDEDSSSPAPASSPPAKWTETAACRDEQKESGESLESVSKTFFPHEVGNGDAKTAPLVTDAPCVKKRLFDVESLLAPETKRRPSKEDFSRGIAERNNNNNNNTHSTVKVDTKDFSEKILKCEHDIDITASQNTRHQGDINSSGLMSSQIAKSIDELQKLGSGTSDGISSKPDPTYASAFHSMLPSTWSALSTYAYPIMSGTHYSITVPVSTFAGTTKKWPSNFSDLGRRPSPEKEVQVDV